MLIQIKYTVKAVIIKYLRSNGTKLIAKFPEEKNTGDNFQNLQILIKLNIFQNVLSLNNIST